MINRFPLILVFTLFVSALFAQPANDNCVNATEIMDFDGGCVDFNSTMSTFDLLNGDCVDSPDDENIWFSFVAQGTDIDISVDALTNDIFVTLIEFDPTPCDFASATQIACGSANGGNVAISYGYLTPGNTYYIVATVANNAETSGTICINKADPIPTLGQWGLIILGIVLLTFGVVMLNSKEKISAGKV